MDRKEFIHSSGRWLLLAIIGLVTGFLALNKRIEKDPECVVLPVCRGCNQFSKCTLPQADKQRGNGEES
ncbi:MAG: hypothetical protein GXO81_02590 [Chlorobi bacterium]|nr:hypothetical protein [Chlorobiota bacterium]